MQFSQTILYIVIACNVLKIVLMVTILSRLSDVTIVTVGDAIMSFLQQADTTTRDCCLMSRRTIDQVWKRPELRNNQRYETKKRQSWFTAVSGRRWGLSLSL